MANKSIIVGKSKPGSGQTTPLTALSVRSITALVVEPYTRIADGAHTQRFAVMAVSGSGTQAQVKDFAGLPEAQAYVTTDPDGLL